MCLRNIKESWRKTPTTHIRLDPSPSTNIGRPPGPRRGHKKGTFGMIRLGDGRPIFVWPSFFENSHYLCTQRS